MRIRRSDINAIVLISTCFVILQKMIAVRLTTKMRTMKILVLDCIGSNLGAAVDFVKCFPCLEKLYVFVSIHIRYFKCQNQHQVRLLIIE